MTVRLAMNYTEVDLATLDRLVEDDGVVFEQKMDGTRVLAVVTAGQPVRFLQRSGGVLAHSAAVQHLDPIRPVLQRVLGHTPGEIVFDGELIVGTGQYHLFDLPYARFGGAEVIQPTDPYRHRRAALNGDDLEHTFRGTPVRVVRQAYGWRDKAALVDRLRMAGAEGFMAKRLDGFYLPGQRSKTDVKVKFVKTADVVVTEVNRPDPKHGNFALAVHGPDGALVSVGGCSAIGKDPETAVGDVIEIAFLYWTGASVYQPRMLRRRPDKKPSECTLEQFPEYSREAV